MKSILPLAAAFLLVGCQPPDPRAECARLEAETLAVVNRNTRPPVGLDPIGERRFYLQDRWNIDFQLLEVANPYGDRLKVRDVYTFCESLTGRSALPGMVPNPFR